MIIARCTCTSLQTDWYSIFISHRILITSVDVTTSRVTRFVCMISSIQIQTRVEEANAFWKLSAELKNKINFCTRRTTACNIYYTMLEALKLDISVKNLTHLNKKKTQVVLKVWLLQIFMSYNYCQHIKRILLSFVLRNIYL